MGLAALLNAGDGQGSDEHLWQLVLHRNQRCKDWVSEPNLHLISLLSYVIRFKVILVMRKENTCFREDVLQSWLAEVADTRNAAQL